MCERTIKNSSAAASVGVWNDRRCSRHLLTARTSRAGCQREARVLTQKTARLRNRKTALINAARLRSIFSIDLSDRSRALKDKSHSGTNVSSPHSYNAVHWLMYRTAAWAISNRQRTLLLSVRQYVFYVFFFKIQNKRVFTFSWNGMSKKRRKRYQSFRMITLLDLRCYTC